MPQRGGTGGPDLSGNVIKTMTPVNRAIAGVAGLPGDIESLLALGVNKVGDMAGVNVGATNLLPNSTDMQGYMQSAGVPMRSADSALGRTAQDAAQFGLESLGVGGLGGAVKGATKAGLAAGRVAATPAETFLAAAKGAQGGASIPMLDAKRLAFTGAMSGAGANYAGEQNDQNPYWRMAGGLAGAFAGAPLSKMLLKAPKLTPEQALATAKGQFNLADDAAQQFTRNTSQGYDPKAAAAIAEASTLPVPVQLTRGQATRFDPILRAEQGAFQGRFGDGVASDVRPFAQAQQQALADNIPRIQGQLARNTPVVQPGEGAQMVQDYLASLEKNARGKYQNQYKAARDLKADLPVDVAQALHDKALAAIEDFHPTSSTQARTILADMQAEIAGSPNGLVSLNAISTRLSQLGKAAGNSAQMTPEQAAAAAARGAGKDALHSIPGNQLPASAQGFVEAWDGANGAYKNWAQLYKKNPGSIPTLTEKLTRRAQFGADGMTQVADNPLADIYRAKPRELQQLKGVLGEASPEWNALRQDYWTKLMEPVVNHLESAKPTSGLNASRALESALKTKGKQMAVLFSPEEMATIKAYGRTAWNVGAGPSAYNTASDLGNAVQQLARGGTGIPFLGDMAKAGANAWNGFNAKRYINNPLVKATDVTPIDPLGKWSPAALEPFMRRE